MPTLVELGLENEHTMLKILSGHFYTQGAIEEMLAEQFGFSTLDVDRSLSFGTPPGQGLIPLDGQMEVVG
jgi:hypothetical protein